MNGDRGSAVILYLDTSALVKLYMEEAYSDDVRGWVDEAEIVATCRVAFPEAVSALNRAAAGEKLPVLTCG